MTKKRNTADVAQASHSAVPSVGVHHTADVAPASQFNIWFQKFSTLRIVGNTKLESTPFFTSEGAQSGYICRYRLEDGTTGEENFPSGFTLDVPFAKADCHTYQIPIDLLFARDEFDNIQIEVQCPLFENIEEQAVINEAQFIKTSCENFKELLVLSDF